MKPYYETGNGQIFNGDCLEVLQSLPDGSVNCCVTSPPYWGLRDYGVDGQLGLESTPEEYVKNMVAVFREVRRVLRDDGTVWLNLGDSYARAGGWSNNNGLSGKATRDECTRPKSNISNNGSLSQKLAEGLKEKDLVGIPWRVAFALQADGWYLRQDIIWHKPNPMPESVTDRCTKAHEYIFLLSKSQKYFYDHEAIKEKTNKTGGKPRQFGATKQNGTMRNDVGETFIDTGNRNRRSVWTVTTKPFKAAHFATFPPDLIVPCVLAGCPAGGVVLDPFFGAGTTGVVAYNHGRKFIGIELSETYLKDITVPRIEAETKQLKLF